MPDVFPLGWKIRKHTFPAIRVDKPLDHEFVEGTVNRIGAWIQLQGVADVNIKNLFGAIMSVELRVLGTGKVAGQTLNPRRVQVEDV